MAAVVAPNASREDEDYYWSLLARDRNGRFRTAAFDVSLRSEGYDPQIQGQAGSAKVLKKIMQRLGDRK